MGQRILFVMQYDMINPVNEYYQNSGNTVFSSAGVSFFWKQNVRYVLMDDVKRKLAADPDWAKRNFDVAVLMEACLFWVGYKENIGVLGRMIHQLGIPMFILGVGVESPGDYSEGFLSKIGDDMKFFCDCVISCGGDMALRGEFTRHCLEKLDFGGFFVSGCPSLYVAGGSLDISAEKVSRRDFRPMFCGYSVGDVPKAVYRKYSGSAFFAQDRYLKMMYHPERRLPMQADEAWCASTSPTARAYTATSSRCSSAYRHTWRSSPRGRGRYASSTRCQTPSRCRFRGAESEYTICIWPVTTRNSTGTTPRDTGGLSTFWT